MSRKFESLASMVGDSLHVNFDYRYMYEGSSPEQYIKDSFDLPLNQRLMDAIKESFRKIEDWLRSSHVCGIDVYVSTLDSQHQYELWLEVDMEETVEWVVVHRYPGLNGDERFPVWSLTRMSESIHELDYTPMTLQLPDIDKTRARCQYLTILHWETVRQQIVELTSTEGDEKLRQAYHILDSFNPNEIQTIKEIHQ